jgi:hypothetical protein
MPNDCNTHCCVMGAWACVSASNFTVYAAASTTNLPREFP